MREVSCKRAAFVPYDDVIHRIHLYEPASFAWLGPLMQRTERGADPLDPVAFSKVIRAECHGKLPGPSGEVYGGVSECWSLYPGAGAA
jgi:hypothetical protein